MVKQDPQTTTGRVRTSPFASIAQLASLACCWLRILLDYYGHFKWSLRVSQGIPYVSRLCLHKTKFVFVVSTPFPPYTLINHIGFLQSTINLLVSMWIYAMNNERGKSYNVASYCSGPKMMEPKKMYI